MYNQLLSWLRLAFVMGFQDIKQRYRGSVIGPFWSAGSIAATSLGIGFLYSEIFKTSTKDFVPYVTSGLVAWTLITSVLAEGCSAFLIASNLLRNTTIAPVVQIFRVVIRNLIVFGHNLLVVAAVLVFFRVVPQPQTLLVLPGMLLVMINVFWMTFLLAAVSSRFRDVPQVVLYLLQFLIFITPVFWYPTAVGHGHGNVLLAGNPFFHLIQIVREPILGRLPTMTDWVFSGAMAAGGMLIMALTFRRVSTRIVYWI